MSNSRSGFYDSGHSIREVPSLKRSDLDKYEKGKLMPIDSLDKSVLGKLEAHGYLKDKGNLRFYTVHNTKQSKPSPIAITSRTLVSELLSIQKPGQAYQAKTKYSFKKMMAVLTFSNGQTLRTIN